MKLVFRFRYILLGLIVIGLSLVLPSLWGQPDYLNAQVSKRKFKAKFQPPPPPSRGYPGTRRAAISRDSCVAASADLVALAPEFVKRAPDDSQLNETSVWGMTTMARPTLWFLVPYTDRSTKLEFVLQNQQDEIIYRSTIPTPAQEGVMAVSIPSSVPPLELNQDYRWTLKAQVSCGDRRRESKFVEGGVRRVPAGEAGQQGIWYDAVATLASQRQRSPNDLQLRQDWEGLLETIQLAAVAKYPLLK